MSVNLTANFLSNARGITLLDGGGITWSINKNTNAITAAGGGTPSPLTTKGDLYGYSTVAARIPVGADTFVLTADSTQTLGLKWATPSPLTTKGDLYGFSTVPARIPIGTDGQVLTADSTQTPGLKWAASAGSSTNVTPDTHPSSPTIYDDEFEFGSVIDTTGARSAGASPWTAFNLSTATSAVSQGALVLNPVNSGGNTLNGYSQPIAGATWQYDIKCSGNFSSPSTGFGMYLATALGAAGKMLYLSCAVNNSVSSINFQQYTNATTFSSTVAGVNINSALGVWRYLRVAYNGTNIIFSHSPTGHNGSYVTLATTAPGTFLGSVPTLWGICANLQNTIQSQVIYDWVRKTA